MSVAEIQFLGAARQVTGSCYLVEAGGLKVLVDCGLHQERPFLARNWESFPFVPADIDFVLVTHAHLDHCGLLPKLAREGFAGRILATPPTGDILGIALVDAAHIQEEDAERKKKRHKEEGRTGPYPVKPLYTVEDVSAVLPLVEEVPYDEETGLGKGLSVRFREAGHILGSASLELTAGSDGDRRVIVFSGDIGQRDKPFVRDPYVFREADYLVMESTYGDREHLDPEPPEAMLAEVILRTVRRGGNVVIPTFAIERAQDLMFYLSRLVKRGVIPAAVPVYLDSPMALEVTGAFLEHRDYFDEESAALLASGENPFAFPGLRMVRTIEESTAINSSRTPAVIMAGSGMCTGGRVKHHLAHNLPRPESTVLFVGYQARGTLGRQILDGSPKVRVLGKEIPVRAGVEIINGFSAHADRSGLLSWAGGLEKKPRAVFVCHGDEEVAVSFAAELKRRNGWRVEVPSYRERASLD
jgi:metallo-beta-lactamase family protein